MDKKIDTISLEDISVRGVLPVLALVRLLRNAVGCGVADEDDLYGTILWEMEDRLVEMKKFLNWMVKAPEGTAVEWGEIPDGVSEISVRAVRSQGGRCEG